jgi:hypothetical protein
MAWRGFAFDPGARVVSEHLMLRSGEWVRERRTRESLERGGDPPEGAHSPQARRGLARGGVQPSSEEKFRPRGVSSPRARWSFGGTALGPSSEAEFRPRGAGADRLMGR